MQLGCTWDRRDPRLLGEQPCNGDLRPGRGLRVSDLAQQRDQCQIGLPCYRLKARKDVANIVALELRVLVDGAGQEALTEWAERHEADPQFFQRGHDGSFGLAPP